MTQVENNTESHKGTHLTFGEMNKIEGYKEIDYSNRKIGRLLKRDHQTINNAIHTGKVTQKRQQKQNGKTYTYYDEVYSADAHYEAYLQNRRHSGRRPKWVETDDFVDWADTKMLEDKWSPDVVVEKAKEKFPASIVPCTSTLYNWIDSGIMTPKILIY